MQTALGKTEQMDRSRKSLEPMKWLWQELKPGQWQLASGLLCLAFASYIGSIILAKEKHGHNFIAQQRLSKWLSVDREMCTDTKGSCLLGPELSPSQDSSMVASLTSGVSTATSGLSLLGSVTHSPELHPCPRSVLERESFRWRVTLQFSEQGRHYPPCSFWFVSPCQEEKSLQIGY